MVGQMQNSTFTYFSKYTLKYKWFLAGGFLCMSGGLLLSLTIPEILRWFIDSAIMNDSTTALKHLNRLVVLSLSVYLVMGILHYLKENLLYRAAYGIVHEMRTELFRKIEYSSLVFLQKKKTGKLIANLTGNFTTVEDFLTSSLPGFIAQPVIIAGILIVIFLTHWKLAFISMLIFPVMLAAINIFGSKIRQSAAKVQSGNSAILSFLHENFSSIRVVKIYGREEEEISRFEMHLKAYLSHCMEGVRFIAYMTPVIEIISCIGMVIFFRYGGQEVIHGNLTPGELVKFVTYITMLVPPLKNLSNDYTKLQKTKGALNEIIRMDTGNISVQEHKDCYVLPHISGEVCFCDVTLRYPEDAVNALHCINFHIGPGEKVAVVGRNGSGKTSLVNLLPRLYDPQKGIISIDGHDIRKVSLQSLRSQIAVVPQDIRLFNETVYYNIAYGRKGASKEEVVEAARLAYADGFIQQLPHGYNTIVGELGERLSTGQRQRIAIARAILADPAILILDEATSALDPESEKLVKEALYNFTRNKTCFIIAHRLHTVLSADRIIVLEKGKLVETGTHEELLTLRGVYYDLFYTHEYCFADDN